MSAFLIVRQSKAVHLLSDAARWNPDGVVTSFQSKLRTLHGSDGAMTMRGDSEAISEIAAQATAFPAPCDQLIIALPILLKLAEVNLESKIGAVRARNYELVIVGWSKYADAPVTFFVTGNPFSKVQGYNNSEPGNVYKIGAPLWGMPPIGDDALARNGFVAPSDIESFDLRRDGVAWFEATRREPCFSINDSLPVPVVDGHLIYGGPLSYVIGGFVEAVTVTHDGASKQLLHTWPDRVGEQIDPFREVA